MSSRHRTNKKPKGYGYDFNGKRLPGGHCQGYGPFAKRVTHRAERRQAAREIARELQPQIEPDSLYPGEPDYNWWEDERYDEHLHMQIEFGAGDKDCFPVR
jgi:hypothetical protein